MKNLIIKIKDFFYFWKHIEITEWKKENMFVIWIRIGFRLIKIAIIDKDIRKYWFKRIKECWRWTDYYTLRENEIYEYNLDNKNCLYRHSF